MHITTIESKQRHLCFSFHTFSDKLVGQWNGHHNKDIARKLGISHRTVEIHKSNIMHKTGANHLLDLARIAHKSGLKE